MKHFVCCAFLMLTSMPFYAGRNEPLCPKEILLRAFNEYYAVHIPESEFKVLKGRIAHMPEEFFIRHMSPETLLKCYKFSEAIKNTWPVAVVRSKL